ncbi:MAG: hypothetical protein LBJ92_04255 [Holosporales bacterium]|jgi:hypothetical protein|nr:hypothetical protein [Holosporales bacterium]
MNVKKYLMIILMELTGCSIRRDVAVSPSTGRTNPEHQNDSNQAKFNDFVKILLKYNFSSLKAEAAWKYYRDTLWNDVCFTDAKLMEHCLLVHGDIVRLCKDWPHEIRENFTKRQETFFEFVKCLKRFRIDDSNSKGTACCAIEAAYSEFLKGFLWEHSTFFDGELLNALNKPFPELSPVLRCVFGDKYTCRKFGNFRPLVPNVDFRRISGTDLALILVHYGGDCSVSSGLYTFLYNSKERCFPKDGTEIDHIGEIDSGKDPIEIHYLSPDGYSWDPVSRILTVTYEYRDTITYRYKLDIKRRKWIKLDNEVPVTLEYEESGK